MTTFLLTLGIFASCVLIYVTIVFLLAQLKGDNSIMDIFYGPAFMVSLWATILLTLSMDLNTYLVALLVTLWATRLSLRIARKNWGKAEDPRYRAWRTAWSQHGKVYFVLRSYLQINLLQGLVVVVVGLPLVLAVVYGPTLNQSVLLLGVCIFFCGLIYESIADFQLDRFLARKKAGTEPATLMTTGLFRFSRRPNYFGESVIWWGFAVMTLSAPIGFLGLLSPLLITYILTKVTGPMLEAIFLEKYPDEYKTYMNKTSYLVPFPPKK